MVIVTKVVAAPAQAIRLLELAATLTEATVELETLAALEVEFEEDEVEAEADVPRALAACLFPARSTAVKLEKP